MSISSLLTSCFSQSLIKNQLVAFCSLVISDSLFFILSARTAARSKRNQATRPIIPKMKRSNWGLTRSIINKWLVAFLCYRDCARTLLFPQMDLRLRRRRIKIIAIAICPCTFFLTLRTGNCRYDQQGYKNIFHNNKLQTITDIYKRSITD